MTEDNNERVAWLLGELDELKKKNVIGGDTVRAIRGYYEGGKKGSRPGANAVLSALGLCLIAAGIISVIAFNWTAIPRVPKVALSLFPLISAIGLFLGTRRNTERNVRLREGTGGYWFLSIGATIALISQTYSIHGELHSFLLIWLALGFPVMYLAKSSLAYALTLAWAVWWAGAAQIEGETAVFFWPFIAASLPFFIARFRENRYAPSVIRLSLATAVALTAGLGISLEKSLPGLWIIAYPSLFSLLYTLSAYLYPDRKDSLSRPFQWYSVCALAILLLMLAYEWPWNDIGWNHYRDNEGIHAIAGAMDYLLAGGFFLSSIGLLALSVVKKKKIIPDWSLAPVVVGIAYLAVSFEGQQSAQSLRAFVMLGLNLYILYLGVRTFLAGIELREMPIINGGMLLVGALIVMRFFDLDWSLMAKGVAFILVGVSILALNWLISKKIGGNA